MNEAFEKVRKELEALSDAALIHINIDIPTALATAFGALPTIRAMRPRIESETKGIDLKLLDKLETYMLALFHAQTLYATATRPAQSLPELVESATMLRDTLYADALALAHHGLLDAEQLRGVKTGPGHRPLAFDLTCLSEVMRSAWESIAGRTAVQPEELSDATGLAERLLAAVGQREFAPAVASEAGNVRQRAFTLFMRAYDEYRRAVTFLRWREGDADKLAPSLYAGRSSSSRRKSADEDGTTAPPAPEGDPPDQAPGNASPSSEPGNDPQAAPKKASETGVPGGGPHVAA